MIEMWALCGLVLAGASVISNDAVQNPWGRFMASNKKTAWWKLWGAASVGFSVDCPVQLVCLQWRHIIWAVR